MAQVTIEQAIEIGRQHQQAGRLAEAEQIYRQILALQPNHANALRMLGLLARQANRHDAAADLLRRAIAVNPSDVESYNDLAIALSAQGRLEEATAALAQAVRLRPGAAQIHFNLGTLLANRGCDDEAIAAFRQALRLMPAYPSALNNLGNSLRTKGRIDEAIAAYNEALRVDPAFHDACNNLGLTLAQVKRFDEAIAVYRQALQLKPDSAVTHYNFAIAMGSLGRLDEAIAGYFKALELDPAYADAYNNLGNALKDCGRRDEALGCFDRAMALNPRHPPYHSNRLFALQSCPGYDGAALYAEHCRWGQRHAEPLKNLIQPHRNVPDPHRRLKIGFLSPDLQWHPVGRFLLPFLERHDRTAFEVSCYADEHRTDEMTRLLTSFCAAWRNISGLSDEQIADRVRADGIDILVDLAGHTARTRLLVFARKPAPVQVTWLGYPNTTGMTAIDYRITDAFADPPGMTEQFHTERIERLPHAFLCFCQVTEAIPVAPLPALARGHVTFGSFNTGAKITPLIVALWARILQQVEGAKLLVKHGALASNAARKYLLDLFATHGIASDRLELQITVDAHLDHLRIYDRVDIALDTFPYHGTTTTCEALWMGAPVVSLAGGSHVSRVGVSILSNVGLEHLVAQNGDEYVRIALELAADLPRLAELRGGLRERIQNSPLMDGPLFARNMGAAFRAMWRRWCET